MNKMIVWKKLEEQKQQQRERHQSEYQSTVLSIQKLQSHLDRLGLLTSDYTQRHHILSQQEHYTSQTQVVRNTVSQILQLQKKAEDEMYLLQNKLQHIQNRLQACAVECLKFEKLREMAEQQALKRIAKQTAAQTDALALQTYYRQRT